MVQESINPQHISGQKVDLFQLFDLDKNTTHPSIIARMMEDKPVYEVISAYLKMTAEKRLLTFICLNPSYQHRLAKQLPDDEIEWLMNTLSSDERLAFLSGLSELEREDFMRYLSDENRRITDCFLNYQEDSVARLVNTHYATIGKEMTIAEAGIHLRKNYSDSEAINVVCIVDKTGHLLDDIQIRRLVLSSPEQVVESLMDKKCDSLRLTDKIEEAIDKFMDYDRIVLPVVDDDNKLIGVVTIDDIMDASERMETHSMQKFGAVDVLDYPYVDTSVWKLTQKRVSWLIFLFVGEMLTATAMGYFENEIASAVVLALFVPLIISSEGNSGSQAATLIIRALSLKEIGAKDWWLVMRREILSGILLGSILGSIGLLRITIWQLMGWYDYGVHWLLLGLTIFFSLIGIVLWGTLSGAMIPLLLKKLKLDPATSSAPFVATLVDVTGLIIYFSIAAIILKGTLL